MPSLPPPVNDDHLIRSRSAPSIYERFWSKADVREANECWPWMACLCKTSNYGRFSAGWALGGPKVWNAPRVAYVLAIGPIPRRYQIDHLCHTYDPTCIPGGDCPHRRCVNPAHLEPVTQYSNALRREWRRLTCSRGHAREGNRGSNGANTRCKVCHRIKMQHWRETGVYAYPGEAA